MIDSTDTTDQSVRFNERTGRAVLRRVGWYAAVACAGGIAFAMGYGWANWLLAYWFFLCLVGWLSNTLKATEWTVAGRELADEGGHLECLRGDLGKPSHDTDLAVEVAHRRVAQLHRAGELAVDQQRHHEPMSASTTGAETGRTDIDC